MRAGGTAFDACVAAAFASTVAEPALTSLGGGGFLLAYESAARRATLFDFFADTPGRGRSASALEPHFIPIPIHFTESIQTFNVGRGSVAVPGTLKGLLHVHERLGQLQLREVLKPAICLARDGVQLSKHQAHFLEILNPIMSQTPQSSALFTRNGAPLASGERLKNPDLACFLEALPDDRGQRFYEGKLAERIEQETGEDGILTAEDLASYEVIERRPLEIEYRGQRVLTNPPPAFGGSLLALSLALLESQPLAELRWGSAGHLMLLITLQMEADRLREAGGLERFEQSLEVPVESAQRLRQATRGTTHISVCDANGNLASMTSSNGEGSGIVVPETGIMLNNMMGEDDLHPEGFHASPAGKRVSSMMSPTIVLREEKPPLVLGSGGSKRIRGAILQVLTHVLDFGHDLSTAVYAPRVHWDGEHVQVEPGFAQASLEALARRWPVNLWSALDVYFGGVHAVVPHEGGAGDPRRGGAVESVD